MDRRNVHLILRGALALSLANPQSRRFSSAADAKVLPELKPGTVRELFVVSSIGSGDVTCGERPDIGRFKHFLQLLNVVNDALNVHAFQSWGRRCGAVKRTGLAGHVFPLRPGARPFWHEHPAVAPPFPRFVREGGILASSQFSSAPRSTIPPCRKQLDKGGATPFGESRKAGPAPNNVLIFLPEINNVDSIQLA